MTTSRLTQLQTVDTLRQALAEGCATPAGIAERALRRRAQVEPVLNAFTCDMSTEILRRAASLPKGPLHGIPVAIKDIIDVAGVPTGHASRAVAPALPDHDAACVAALRAAGAQIFGKTNLLEFAYGVVHPAFGQTNNPWDPARTSGGSSGGSAAAVAAGVVPLALGTDTGGSVRAPAAYCGIVGLKPSYGLLSLDGVFPLSPSLDHLGVLASDVAGASVALTAMGGPAIRPAPQDLKGLRIGIDPVLLGDTAIHPGVRQAMGEALERLCNDGAELVEIALPAWQQIAETLLDVLLYEAALIHRQIPGADPDGYAPGTLDQIREGLTRPVERYATGKLAQEALMAGFGTIMTGVDLLAAPTVPYPAPGADPSLTGDDADDEILSLAHANLTGAPAISLPCGLAEGLPVGLQLTAARGADADLMRWAARVERLLDFGGTRREA